MASVNIAPMPKLQFFDGNGDPLAGGLLYTKHGGTNNDKATYTDSTGTVAHANPIVLDSEGRASIFLTSGAYKFILTTAEGAAVYTADGVSSSFQVASVDTITDMKALTIGNNTFIRTLGRSAVNDGGGWTYYWDATSTDADDGGMTIQPASLPAAGRWKGVFPDNRELNLKVFGAACDGTTNDVNAIIACDAYCNANGVTMAVDDNTYFATDPTIESRVRLLPGAQLRWGNFQPTIDVLIDNDDQTRHFNCSSPYVPVTKFNNIFPEWFGETVSSYPIATAASAAADCASIVVIKSPVKITDYFNPASIRTTGRINNTGSASAGLVFDASDNATQTGNLIVSGYVKPASVRTTGRINNTGATTQGLIFDGSNNLTQTGTLTATGVLTAASVKTTGRINNTGSASAGLVFDSSDNATQTGNLIVSGYENPASIRTTGRINNTGSASAGLVFDSSDNAKQTGNLIVSGYVNPASIRTTGRINNTGSASAGLVFDSSDNATQTGNLIVSGYVNPASVRTTGYINYDGTADKGLTFNSGNRVYMIATNYSTGDIRATVLIFDDNPYATGVGGGISFRGKYNTAATYTDFAGIKGVKSNATDGNQSGQLHFQTRLNGSTPATGMILDENKNLTVSGYTNPASIRTTGRINNTGATTQGLIFDGSNNLTQTGTLTVSDSITAASVVAENIYSVLPNMYTATINGCVDETATIVYGIIGRVVFVQFDLNEVSNTNYLQIVLPVPCYPNIYYTSSFICEVESNGVAGIGYGMIDGAGSFANIGFNSFFGLWTPTGTKKAKGSFWYTRQS